MRKNKVLAKIRAGESARLAMMGYFLPPFVAYAAHYGFDGIWLDLEHHNFDRREVQSLLSFCHLYDIDCYVRPATREKAELYRYFEDGAAGLIIPHVNDVEAARDLVQKVKFPPIGDRGLHGRGLEGNFGLDTAVSRAALAEHARQETALILQIETLPGLEQAAAMAVLPGVDGLYVGPADLSLRLPYQPEGNGVTLETALQQIATICREHGKFWGCLPRTTDELRQHIALGSTFLVWGVDARILQDGLAQSSRDITGLLDAKS